MSNCKTNNCKNKFSKKVRKLSPDEEVLRDILNDKLLIVFCGTAVGNTSAKDRCYYKHHSNKFWSLFAKITERELSPKNLEDCKEVLKYGIGLTDLNKKDKGLDSDLSEEGYKIKSFKKKMLKCSPKLIVFNGKKAAKKFFHASSVSYGLQDARLGGSAIFIAPSTSGSSDKDWGKYGECCWTKIGEMYNEMKNARSKK